MFYSHEVLSSRKYGFATVWLVATMGSGAKKVSRKAILDVDVVKTCETIAQPSVPLALRLQSSLLYGVVKVYSQQCNYVLVDAETARNHMRQVFKSIRESGLMAERAPKGRADNLILPDDPAYLPELDLNMDLDLNFDAEQFSNLALTNSVPQSTPHNASQLSASLALGSGLRLDTPRLPASANLFSILTGLDPVINAAPQYEGLQDDLGIDFDFDGDAQMKDSPLRHITDRSQPRSSQLIVGDHMQLDEELDMFGQQNVSPRQRSVHGDRAQNNDLEAEAVTSEAVQVQLRQQRRRIVPLDSTTELRSHELRLYQENYVANMAAETQRKGNTATQKVSKDNALHWFLNTLPGRAEALNTFHGWELINVLTNLDLSTPRSAQKARPDERADIGPVLEEYTEFVPDHTDIEYGREQPTPLADFRQSSMMPWNISSGLRRQGSQAAGSMALSGRSRLPSLQPNDQSPYVAQYADLQSTEAEAPGTVLREYTAQPTTESQWLRNALHDESMNFLTFVSEAIQQRAVNGEAPSVTFSTLLPPVEHTAMTAAQAFLHVLTLGNKNKLKVAQRDALFGEVAIWL